MVTLFSKKILTIKNADWNSHCLAQKIYNHSGAQLKTIRLSFYISKGKFDLVEVIQTLCIDGFFMLHLIEQNGLSGKCKIYLFFFKNFKQL